jgi:hypothetical protein
VSINLEDDGRVSICVRSEGDGSNTGPVGVIYVDQVTAANLFHQASMALARHVLDELPKSTQDILGLHRPWLKGKDP